MARTFDSTLRNKIAAARLDVYGKLEVTDPDGTWVDVSTDLDSPDWWNSATLTESLDAHTMSFTAVLLASTGALSLMPLMEGSTINRDSEDDYAPMLDLARQWRLSVAVTTHGVAPVGGDWRVLGVGYIDTIEMSGNGQTITITGRDAGAQLLDYFISVPRQYGSGDGIAMETVIQSILTDNLGGSAPTLYTPVSPGFVISPAFTQQPENLMVAINQVAELAGFVVRYRYDASNVLRLTLYCPDRDAAVADYTVAASEYLALPLAKLDLSGVRNYIEVKYLDASTGLQATVISPSAGTSDSITRYGKRYMAIDCGGEATRSINSAVLAQAFADAVCADLQLPLLEQQFETFALWIVQLGDYVKFTHNDVHYDVDQYGGVTGYTHTFANGTVKTLVDVRGQPAGRYRAWTTLESDGVALAAPSGLVCQTGEREPRMLVGWDAGTDARIGYYEIEARQLAYGYKLEDDVYWKCFPTVGPAARFTYVAPVEDGQKWAVRVRAVMADGITKSGWSDTTHVVDVPTVAEITVPTREASASSITYTIGFGDGAEWVEVFSMENAGSGGTPPTETDAFLCGRLQKPAGSSTGYFTIATGASRWRRTIVVGYTRAWERGTAVGPLEDQAQASVSPIDAPTISSHTDHETSIDLTVAHNGVITGDVRIYVNSRLWTAVANTGGVSQVVSPGGLDPLTAYSITATQYVGGVESAHTAALSTTTTAYVLDAPTNFDARGHSTDKGGGGYDVRMGFSWTRPDGPGHAAQFHIQQSTTGDWAGEEETVTLYPDDAALTSPGAVEAGSNMELSGTFYFRVRAERSGYTSSAWTDGTETATYGSEELL